MIKYLDDVGIKHLVEKLDERHVNTSGDQTIAGNKVFTGTTSTMTLHTYNPLYVNNGTDNSKNTSLYTDTDGVFKIVNSSSNVERPTYNGTEMALTSDLDTKQDKCIDNNILYVGDTSLIGLSEAGAYNSQTPTVQVGSLDNQIVIETNGTKPQWSEDGETLKTLADEDDITDLQNQINNSASKLELISLIERVGGYRYLRIYTPYSDALLNEINNGKVHLQLYKQSKKKITDTRNAYVKWVSPTKNIGFGSEHFKRSFSENYTVDGGGISIPPSIPVGEDSHNLLDVAYNMNFIQLSYNLSDLSKAMCFLKNDYSVIPAEWDGSLGDNLYTDTVIHGSNVIGKRFRNNRVALRYKFRLFFETTQTYSEFTDTITIVYTKYRDMDYISIGMQIN